LIFKLGFLGAAGLSRDIAAINYFVIDKMMTESAAYC